MDSKKYHYEGANTHLPEASKYGNLNATQKKLLRAQHGNFKYDITLWNGYTGDPNTQHVDWMSFSSTVEPNNVDVGEHADYSEPTTGTYVNVMNRNLNGQTYLENNTMAGAMMWNLSNLEPNESTSMTLALMYGAGSIETYPTILTKTNADPNNAPVYPWNMLDENYLTYDICYNANGYALNNVTITDTLPTEVDYYSSNPSGTYDANARTVTWTIGNLDANDSNCIQLVTKVNNAATQPPKFLRLA